MILAGNGSDEILAIAMRTFLGPGDVLAYPDPTYSLYPVLAESAENRVVTVPWEADWRAAHRGAPRDRRARHLLRQPQRARPARWSRRPGCASWRAAFDGLLLVDEAYVDFADENCLDLVRELPNVMICRTFSKGYSLAGLRFGYAIAAPALVAEMTKVKDSYNCDAISILAATAALEDQAYARATWQAVRAERARLVGRARPARLARSSPARPTSCSRPAPAGKPPPSTATSSARASWSATSTSPGLADKLRITIGTAEQNDALLGALPG